MALDDVTKQILDITTEQTAETLRAHREEIVNQVNKTVVSTIQSTDWMRNEKVARESIPATSRMFNVTHNITHTPSKLFENRDYKDPYVDPWQRYDSMSLRNQENIYDDEDEGDNDRFKNLMEADVKFSGDLVTFVARLLNVNSNQLEELTGMKDLQESGEIRQFESDRENTMMLYDVLERMLTPLERVADGLEKMLEFGERALTATEKKVVPYLKGLMIEMQFNRLRREQIELKRIEKERELTRLERRRLRRIKDAQRARSMAGETLSEQRRGLLWRVWDIFTKELMAGAFGLSKNIVSLMTGFVSTAISLAIPVLTRAFGMVTKNPALLIWGTVIAGVVDGFKSSFDHYKKSKSFLGLFESGIAGIVGRIVELLTLGFIDNDKVHSTVERGLNTITDIIGKVIYKMIDGFVKVKDRVVEFMETLRLRIIELLNKIPGIDIGTDQDKKIILQNHRDKLEEEYRAKISEGDLDAAKKIRLEIMDTEGQLRKMARGGIVRSATRAIVGEGQDELVTPLHRLDDLVVNPAIEQTLRAVMAHHENAALKGFGGVMSSGGNTTIAPVTNNVVTQQQATPFVAPMARRNTENTFQRAQDRNHNKNMF